jgi:hypothetical protein
MTPIELTIFHRIAQLFSAYFSIVSIVPCSLFLMSLLRRDSTSQEFAIQVGTPRRGSTQRINTIYAARNPMNHNQSSMSFSSSLPRSMIGDPTIGHVINAIKAFDHSFIVRDHDDCSVLHASQVPEQIHHGLTALRIKGGRRLVS